MRLTDFDNSPSPGADEQVSINWDSNRRFFLVRQVREKARRQVKDQARQRIIFVDRSPGDAK